MIAVDAMGGDHAPDQIVKGVLLAAKKQIPIMLFGQEQQLISILQSHDLSWQKYNILICNTTQIAEMAEEPSYVFRKKRDSSLIKAIEYVKNGICNAVVSAGNSGVIMFASTLILGRQDGIERPAIIGELPVCKKRVLCLDLGANADCKPEYLLQFAYLGDSQAKKVLGIENPRVALLCNGHEDGKGSILIRKAFELLKKSDLNFIGNIEPYGIFKNMTDVLVCDGFSGNILLKTIETLAEIFSVKKYSLGQQKGGALLAGVNGNVVIAHGNADSKAIERAIVFAFNNIERENINHERRIFEKPISRMVT